MAQPEWGTKRTCPNCGVRFYDLGKKPITCPSCESSFEAEAFIKTRRSRQSAPVESRKPAAKPQTPAKEAADAPGKRGDPAGANDADGAHGAGTGEEDDAVLPAAADTEDESDDVAELVDKPGESKEES